MIRAIRAARAASTAILTMALTLPALGQVELGDFDGNGTIDVLITGSGKKQNVLISDRPATAELVVSLDLNGDGDFTDGGDLDAQTFTPGFGAFEVIELRLGGGSDQVTYTIDSDLLGLRRAIVANLGKGKNTFGLSCPTPISLAGSDLAVEVHGQKGSQETVGVDLSKAASDGTNLALRLLLGGGVDDATVTLGSFANTNTAHIDAELGGKNDTLTLIKGGAVAGDTTIRAVVDAGGGNDTIDVGLFGALDGSSTIECDADLGDGNDLFDVFVDRPSFSVSATNPGSRLVLRGNGGSGNDGLFVGSLLTVGTIPLDGLFDVAFSGGEGKDVLRVGFDNPDALGFITPDTGLLRLRLDGGNGDDIVNTNLSNDAASFPRYDVVQHGGPGNDQMSYGAVNPNAAQNGPANFPPAGVMLADGGEGVDGGFSYGNASGLIVRNVE